MLLAALSLPGWSQEPVLTPPVTQTPADTTSSPVALVQPYEAGHDYLNFYAFVNGLVDTTGFAAGTVTDEAGAGIEGGGGVSAFHQWAKSDISLSYRGDYRSYFASGYPDGTDQNLNFLYRRMFSKRWSLAIGETAGIFNNSGTYVSTTPAQSQVVQLNPFTNKTKFAGTTLTLSYQQTKRLSYDFTGSWFLQRYNYSVGAGNSDLTGSASVLYRWTRRTTFSGSYSHSYFQYQGNRGSSDVDTVYLTLSHEFATHWRAGASGGFTHTSSAGTAFVPVAILVDGQLVTGYVLGQYDQKAFLPYLQGTLARTWRHSVFTATGGESVTPGNGLYLASRTIGVSGIYSLTMRRSNFSAGGNFSRLSTLSTPIPGGYVTGSVNASYAYNVVRHLGVNFRYYFVQYGNVGSLSSRSDNRFSFGLYISSKDVPVGLF
jgi:hypothetical protein